MKHLHKKVLDYKLYIILGLVLLLTVLYFYPGGTVTSFDIQDKCGRFVNLFSHTIETESQCELRCTQQCRAKDATFKKVEFQAYETQCNQCTCYCKE